MVAAGVGRAPPAGGEAVPWPADEAGRGVGDAGTCADPPGCRGDEDWCGAGGTVGDGAAPDGDGDGLSGAVGCGVGEADGRWAGQIFTGTSPAGAHGAAAAGSARTSGEAASTNATADVKQAFRVEFILPILRFRRFRAGHVGPVRLRFLAAAMEPGSACRRCRRQGRWDAAAAGSRSDRVSGCVGATGKGKPAVTARSGPTCTSSPAARGRHAGL